MHANVFNIQRFSTRDGPGIRTTVFFQGCNLCCAWCHNPESIPSKPVLQFFEDRCISCGQCVAACSSGAHTMEDGRHRFHEEKCTYNTDCAAVCPRDALKADVKRYSLEELTGLLLRDLAYYRNSGGGVTVSGGEPLLQAPFVQALFARLQADGVHTALDTAANMPWPVIESLIPSTDLFLVDLKSIDPQVHHTYTRADNRLILDNIRALSQAGAQIEIRMPLIAGINDSADFARRSAEYLSALPIPPAVRLLPYHNYGLYKAQSIRRPMEEFCAPRQADDFAHVLRGYDLIVCAD
ncbi:MAG: glycyl-radical enzyme activating protein [Clostridiales bacterium]|nr:glycyl-radical enzyme activating protein [Clostridiales bacterium]